MEMKRVTDELKKGWEAISQLRQRGFNEGYSQEASDFQHEKLLNIIVESFDTSISVLKSCMEASNSPQISRRETPNHGPADSHALGKQRQLKSNHPRIKTVEVPNLESDGYLWRKYGRKPILNAKHPREYYRCAYKDDQNCQATKHVQMMSKNPAKYKITYYFDHTCQLDLHSNNASQIQNVLGMLEKDCPEYLISFESKNPKQVPNNNNNNKTKKPVEVHDQVHGSSSSTYFRKGGKSSSSVVPVTHDCDEGPSSSKLVDLTKTVTEPSSVAAGNDNGDSLKQTEVVYSPSTLMSPNYYMGSYLDVAQVEDYSTLIACNEQYLNMDGAWQLQDIPLWEDDQDAFAFPNLFSP